MIYGQAKNAAYAILVDNTGTMRTQFDNVQALSGAIAQNSVQRGFVSLYAFETQRTTKESFARIVNKTNWSQDKNALEQSIGGIYIVPGQTVLFDAISTVVKNTAAKADSEGLKEKIVILITDGEDRGSRMKEKDLIAEVKANGVKIYAIGLVTELNSVAEFTGKNTKNKAVNFLKTITKESGGNIIFPKINTNTNIEDILAKLFAESGKI